MKKLFVILALAVFTMGSFAQTEKKDSTATKSCTKTELKEHVCTSACKDGKHVYAHGEKGHVCTDACKKKM